MNEHPATDSRARRYAAFFALARSCCACLALAGTTACTALIDGELAGKRFSGGHAGSTDAPGGSGGAGGGAGGSGSTLGTTTSAPCPDGCALPHATAACSMNVCEIVDCDSGFADCNEARLDGCEADLSEDSQHCGKCGHDCDDDDACKKGHCK